MQPSEAVARGVRSVVVTGMVLVLVSDGGIMCAPCRGKLAFLLSCLPGACLGAVNMVEVEPDMVSAACVRGRQVMLPAGQWCAWEMIFLCPDSALVL